MVIRQVYALPKLVFAERGGGAGGRGGAASNCWAWPSGYAYDGGRGGNITGGQQSGSGGGGAGGPSGPGGNGQDYAASSTPTWGGTGGGGAGGGGTQGVKDNSQPGGNGAEYANQNQIREVEPGWRLTIIPPINL